MSRQPQLEKFQRELLSLKSKYGKSLALRKSSSAESPNTPFPVTLTWGNIEAPADSQYDVGSVDLELCVHQEIFQIWDVNSSSDTSMGPPLDCCITISLRSEDLPKVMTDAIEACLMSSWRVEIKKCGQQNLALDVPIKSLLTDFVAHMSCVPSLLEPYQSVDASGATIRRFAILSCQEPLAAVASSSNHVVAALPSPEISSSVKVDYEVQMDTASFSAPSHGSSTSRGRQSGSLYPGQNNWSEDRASSEFPVLSGLTPGGKAADPPPPHQDLLLNSVKGALISREALESELLFFQRRYKASFKLLQQPATVTAVVLPVADNAAGSASKKSFDKDLTITMRSPMIARTASDVTLIAPLSNTNYSATVDYLFELQPTDPSWVRGPIPVRLSFRPASAAAAVDRSPSSLTGVLQGVEADVSNNSPSPLPQKQQADSKQVIMDLSQLQQQSVEKRRMPIRQRPPVTPPTHRLYSGTRKPIVASRSLPAYAELHSLSSCSWYKVWVCVQPGSPGLPSWLVSFLDKELGNGLISGGGSVAVAAASLKRAVLKLENYGGELALQAAAAHQDNFDDDDRRVHFFTRPIMMSRGTGGGSRRVGNTGDKNAVISTSNVPLHLQPQTRAAVLSSSSRAPSAVSPPGGRHDCNANSVSKAVVEGEDDNDDLGFWSIDEHREGITSQGRIAEGGGGLGSGSVSSSDHDGMQLSDDGYGDYEEQQALFFHHSDAAAAHPESGCNNRTGCGADLHDATEWMGQEASSPEYADDHLRHEIAFQGEQQGGDQGGGATETRVIAGGGGGQLSSLTSGAWHCQLQGLKLDDVEAMEIVIAPFQVCCSRCSATGMLTVSSSAVSTTGGGNSSSTRTAKANASATANTTRTSTSVPFQASGHCPGCNIPWHLLARPRFVHGAANILCVLKLLGCSPLDLLPCLLAVQCSYCSAVMTMRSVQVGLPQERTCSSCHHRLALNFSAASFIPRGPPLNSSIAADGKKGQSLSRRACISLGKGGGRKDVPVQVLQVGMPLPALGTCKHYRHSYRWLRFPCCGWRFPCDLCHEEATDHPLKWATRMVCGFCSSEQPVVSQCGKCGKKLACAASYPLGKSTRYWEGGVGCRDTTFMTKKDPHKFRGKGKTHSNKANRVGPKPWSKELKKHSQQDA
ncbi:hypothetical protein CEUSTIGMA_g5287.t1 [Chlamydomonas eustigma]|uniref:CHY-type domain-containing protein n=1 Tax=Chlamydomonas eustigma TaxID=1157962 RepID=A0A250X451_9CHLO|nr:hypothetical protein CEUSTIGMA_g5287.t1 [Chlamydomonas eustigma]|eukprot:GAX77845.1 hypothetical protein CEUSTIGMA_g5287.t1 [Chlamydomonas eustigma]